MTLRRFHRPDCWDRQTASATTARQRLQLGALPHDRSDLNPELLGQMRREILEVVSRVMVGDRP